MREMTFKIFGNPYLEDIKVDDERYPVKIFDTFGSSFSAFDTMSAGNVHPPGALRTGIEQTFVSFVDYLS